MAKKLYVGNIPSIVDANELSEIFQVMGTVTDAFIVKDRETGNSKNFGFITFENDSEADAAIEKLNNYTILDRNLIVSIAKEKDPNQPKLIPITHYNTTCSLCGNESNKIIGFRDNKQNQKTGACPRCIKALNFILRNKRPN